MIRCNKILGPSAKDQRRSRPSPRLRQVRQGHAHRPCHRIGCHIHGWSRSSSDDAKNAPKLNVIDLQARLNYSKFKH